MSVLVIAMLLSVAFAFFGVGFYLGCSVASSMWEKASRERRAAEDAR